jgi:ceramide glucosyltransferase
VLPIFYILVILQIVLGFYSVLQGFWWLRMVRAQAGTHSGFYAPVAAIICPCKGNEPGLEENLTALTRFDYPNYEIYFSVATSLDPAIATIERVKAASSHPVHIVIAGPAEGCGEKVNNLQRAVELLPPKFEAFVFVDSDVRASRGWLAKIVAPLEDSRIGATTAYRWLIPNAHGGGNRLASAFASAWNAAVMTTLGRPPSNFCWGGGTAIRRTNFENADVFKAWRGAVSDDFTMTTALRAEGKQILFLPECLAPTLQTWTAGSLLEFTTRQMVITRVYSPRRWFLGAMAHWGYSVTIIYAATAILVTMAAGDPWFQLMLIALAIPLLAAIKGGLRIVALNELQPEWKAQFDRWSWAWMALAPVVPFLFSWNFLVSLFTRRIRWRGIRYELVSVDRTRILNR